jgi:hypothetical protein
MREDRRVAEWGLPVMKMVPPLRAARGMEPKRAWVGPSLFRMSAHRTVRSGLSSEYGIGERKKFARCLLVHLSPS